jgi:hypothetical protein
VPVPATCRSDEVRSLPITLSTLITSSQFRAAETISLPLLLQQIYSKSLQSVVFIVPPQTENIPHYGKQQRQIHGRRKGCSGALGEYAPLPACFLFAGGLA